MVGRFVSGLEEQQPPLLSAEAVVVVVEVLILRKVFLFLCILQRHFELFFCPFPIVLYLSLRSCSGSLDVLLVSYLYITLHYSNLDAAFPSPANNIAAAAAAPACCCYLTFTASTTASTTATRHHNHDSHRKNPEIPRRIINVKVDWNYDDRTL